MIWHGMTYEKELNSEHQAIPGNLQQTLPLQICVLCLWIRKEASPKQGLRQRAIWRAAHSLVSLQAMTSAKGKRGKNYSLPWRLIGSRPEQTLIQTQQASSEKVPPEPCNYCMHFFKYLSLPSTELASCWSNTVQIWIQRLLPVRLERAVDHLEVGQLLGIIMVRPWCLSLRSLVAIKMDKNLIPGLCLCSSGLGREHSYIFVQHGSPQSKINV